MKSLHNRWLPRLWHLECLTEKKAHPTLPKYSIMKHKTFLKGSLWYPCLLVHKARRVLYYDNPQCWKSALGDRGLLLPPKNCNIRYSNFNWKHLSRIKSLDYLVVDGLSRTWGQDTPDMSKCEIIQADLEYSRAAHVHPNFFSLITLRFCHNNLKPPSIFTLPTLAVYCIH